MVKRKIHQMIDCSHPTKRQMSVKQQVFQSSIKASTPHLQDTYNFGQHIFTNIRAVKESSILLMTDLFHALLATS